jgi:hypothetical protein
MALMHATGKVLAQENHDRWFAIATWVRIATARDAAREHEWKK